MIILITGGAGYLGTILIETLLNYRNIGLISFKKIVVYDNLLYKQDGIFPLLSDSSVEFVLGDVRDYTKLQGYIQEADYIIPLAAIVGAPACDNDPKLAEEINYRQLYYISQNCPYHSRIIVPNTNSGYGATKDGQPCSEKSPLRPLSVYGVTKCNGEKAVMESGHGCAFRLATVFGTSYRFRKDLLVNDFVLKAMTDKYIVLFESHFKRNFIHIRDVAHAFIRAMMNWDLFKNEVFNLGLSSANLSKLELCEAIKKHIPDFVIKQDDFAKDKDKRNYIVSNKKLENAGWTALNSLDDGIQELIKAYPVLINSGLTTYTNL